MTPGDISNPVWRLSNLYEVKQADTGKPVPFHPKPEQRRIIDAVYVQKLRNILIPKARQLGISTVIALIILDHLLFHSGIQAAIVDLTQLDATKKLRGKIVFAFERLEPEIRDRYELMDNNDHVFSLKIKGSDEAESTVQAGMNARGDTFQILHISEWGKIAHADPRRSEEIITGAMPAAKRGIRIIESTWKGGKGGHLWEIAKSAMETKPEHKTAEDFHLLFFPWHGDPDYALEGDSTQIPADVSRYLDETEATLGNGFRFSPEQRLWYYKVAWAKGLFRFQEYPSLLEECWKAPVEGAIYADMIDKLRAGGSITPGAHDNTQLVHTSWDLGSPINTVTWFWQLVGREIRVIDCDADLDITPTERVARLLAKGYLYGWHFLPHDAAATQKSGATFQTELAAIGLKNTRVVPQTVDIWIGINHLRSLMPRFTFRLPHCEEGIEALCAYHTRRETSGGNAIDQPVHDWSSHYADALRVISEADRANMLGAYSKPVTVKTGYRGDIENNPESPLDYWFPDRNRGVRVIR